MTCVPLGPEGYITSTRVPLARKQSSKGCCQPFKPLLSNQGLSDTLGPNLKRAPLNLNILKTGSHHISLPSLGTESGKAIMISRHSWRIHEGPKFRVPSQAWIDWLVFSSATALGGPLRRASLQLRQQHTFATHFCVMGDML